MTTPRGVSAGTTPRINTATTVANVQEVMNNAVGATYWGRKGKASWDNLLIIRNNFIREKLEESDLTIQKYNELEVLAKNAATQDLRVKFINDFFRYSRRDEQMKAAVGDDDSWIKIAGMENFMVRSALIAITNKPEYQKIKDENTGVQLHGTVPGESNQETTDQSTGAPLQSSVAVESNRDFDPISDAIKNAGE